MKLLDRSIDRPLPVFLAAALVLVLGLWCLTELPINRTPNIEIPLAVVSSVYEGAAPDEVEAEVTIELEEELNTIENLRHLTSVSREGVSVHFVEFEDRTDMSESLRDVRAKADLATPQLPDGADFVVVEEVSFDHEPIIFFTLTGAADLYRLREIAEDLEPILEAVEGVSNVEVFGGYEREVRVQADPVALAEHDLTLADLGRVIRRHGQSLPAGELTSSRSQQLIRSTGEFRSLEEIAAIPVTSGDGSSLALRDVASVELGHERLRSGAWRNGRPSVTLIVRRRQNVNTLETVRRLEVAVERLRPTLPPGVGIVASSDQSDEIGRMLEQLGTSAAYGFALVVGVLIVMFGARQALLVSSVLPFSILFTFAGLYLLGMAISNVALFSVILVLGLVVDGAIVVGEAIQTECESGTQPAAAAKAALAQVGMPVIAADLTTIAAFVPMLLMVGVMGQFMAVMPKVVVFALAGSVFVDHFLLPAASARFRGPPITRRRRVAPDGLPWFSPELPRARRLYLLGLESTLARPKLLLAGVAVAVALALVLFATGAIDSIFLPRVDKGHFSLNYELPPGTGLEETSRVGRLLGREVEGLRDVASYVLTAGDTGALNSDHREGGRVGPHYGRLTVDLVERSERSRSSSEVMAELREPAARYAGVRVDFDQPEEGPPTGSALAIRVKGESLDEIAAIAETLQHRVAALPSAADVRVDYDRGKPEIRVDVDRARAATRFGITPDQVSRALHTAFYGIEVGRMWLRGERTAIRLQADPSYAHTLDNVRSLPLRASDSAIVPLGELAGVTPRFAHNAIFRHDALRTITVRADAAADVSSVTLEQEARAAVAAIGLPHGIHLEFGGESEERDRSYASLWSALKWGILLIYVVIAIQFNSLLQPLIVLVSIPLAVIGVCFGLLATGTPFSFIAFIGIVSLTGIVVNHGIVLIDAINKRRRAGMPVAQAVRTASLQRFRPVILTTVTTIAGLLPLTLGVSEGGEFWVPLGVTIISGLLASTALTLFVVPVLYSLLQSWRIGPALERIRSRPWLQPGQIGTVAGGLGRERVTNP